jgi:hypothetical protein
MVLSRWYRLCTYINSMNAKLLAAVGVVALGFTLARREAREEKPEAYASATPLGLVGARADTAAPATVLPPSVAHQQNAPAFPEAAPTLPDVDEADQVAVAMQAVGAKGAPDLRTLIEHARDLADVPDTSATVIHAVAQLGAAGSASERVVAARTLGSWLTQESAKESALAAANVPNLVEALGELGGPEARVQLVALLDGAAAETSIQTLAVEQLEKAENPRERGAIERYLARLEQQAALPGIEGELRNEGIAAARKALKN